MKKDTDYLFAINKIKVLENSMIDKGILNRMIDAADAGDAYKVLQETPYGEYLNRYDSPYDFDTVLNLHMDDVYKIIDESTDKDEFTLFFRIREDYINSKILLKSINKNSTDFHLSSMGSIPAGILVTCFKNEDFSDLPEFLRKGIKESSKRFNQDMVPGEIDFIMDRHMYEHLYEIAKNDGFLKGYLEKDIDLANIRSFIRVKMMDGDVDFLRDVLLDHGRIDKDFFYDAFNDPISVLPDKLRFSDYASIVEIGIKTWLDTGSSMEMEKLCDNYLLKYAKQGKYSSFGTSPIWGYILGKTNEVKLLRIVLVGKLNNISKELITERLRDAYV